MNRERNKKKWVFGVAIFSFLLVCLFITSAEAANRFWIGPTNGSTNATANWSQTSGGTGGATVPGVYDTANFDIHGLNNAVFDNTMTIGDLLMTNGTGIVTINNGVVLTIGSGSLAPQVSVGKNGVQIPTILSTSTDQDLGGAFTLLAQGGAVDINSFRLRQAGSVGTSSISNIRLYTKNATSDGQCSGTKPAGVALFGTAGSFDENKFSTTTGTISLTPDVPVCLYIVYDLASANGLSTMGRSIDLEISNPVADVQVSTGTVVPAIPVNINGQTIVVANNVSNVTATTTPNPACSDSVIYSMLSLHMSDADKDPTVFYLQNCAVWEKQGTGDPARLTNANLQVHSLTFTNLTGANSNGVVRVEITMSNMDPGQEGTFMNVTQTLKTTAGVRAWNGNN